MTQGDCSAQVLKYKQAGVEYWDWQSFAFVFCMPAKERLGGGRRSARAARWRPWSAVVDHREVDGGRGGLAPRPTCPTGYCFTAPTKAHLEMVEALKRYHPSLAGYQLSSLALGAYYFVAKYIVSGALQGAGDLYGELSSDAVLLKWIYQSH